MQYQTEHVVAADHPCLAGHFPGNPVVPGVVLLDLVAATLAEALPEARLRAVAQAKFVQTLRPGETVTIALEAQSPERVRFDCRRDGASIAAGSLRIDRKPQP